MQRRSNSHETEESFIGLFLALSRALYIRFRAWVPVRVIHGLMTTCGFVAMLTPLALWVSWSKVMLGTVLVVGISAAILFVILAHLLPDSDKSGNNPEA